MHQVLMQHPCTLQCLGVYKSQRMITLLPYGVLSYTLGHQQLQ